jgi:hypothetical protein
LRKETAMGKAPTQFGQDHVHELIDSNYSCEEITKKTKYPLHLVRACAAQYGAFLAGDDPSPYLPGTRLPGKPEPSTKKLATTRIWGDTNGEQVF